MSMSFGSQGSDKTEKFLKRLSNISREMESLERFGREGVAALASATPSESSATAQSWYYEIKRESGKYSIIWGNTNIEDGRPIAILLQHGHATRTGGFVQGRDYINPALQPIFDRMAAEAWKVVTRQ